MTRLISGVLLAAAALAAIVFLPLLPLRLLACAVAALCADEYLRIVGRRRLGTHAAAILLVVWACWWMSASQTLSPIVAVVLGVGWLAIEVLYEFRGLDEAAADLVAPLYIGLPLGMLVAVQVLGGWQATLLLIGTIIVSDSAQYYTGRALGRRPLAPAISPKKTIEGAIGGVVFGIVFVIVAGAYVLPHTTIASRGLLGAVVVMLGITGDLFESRLKRLAGVKDSSNLIPGHGGVFDRIDALLFATPAFYYMVLQTIP
jgi:phosphatidate cytidylyltransferase